MAEVGDIPLEDLPKEPDDDYDDGDTPPPGIPPNRRPGTPPPSRDLFDDNDDGDGAFHQSPNTSTSVDQGLSWLFRIYGRKKTASMGNKK